MVGVAQAFWINFLPRSECPRLALCCCSASFLQQSFSNKVLSSVRAYTLVLEVSTAKTYSNSHMWDGTYTSLSSNEGWFQRKFLNGMLIIQTLTTMNWLYFNMIFYYPIVLIESKTRVKVKSERVFLLYLPIMLHHSVMVTNHLKKFPAKLTFALV